MTELHLSRSQYLELEKIAFGAFRPVDGFMNEDAFRGVVETMRLPDGSVFPLPIVLDVDRETADRLKGLRTVALVHDGVDVGTLAPESVFTCDKASVARQVYGTDAMDHPGVRFFMTGGDWFVGGPVSLTRRIETGLTPFELTPEEAKALFEWNGWKTVTGFQTRNVPHRAHEYLLRVALETTDGLFVQPLVGRKKAGDFTPQAVISAYEALLGGFFPEASSTLGILTTSMRYAGPREAVFHAVVRRNYGCTHFIVGRDHAGVGNYYGKYDAHALTRRFDGELGIEIFRFAGPYHCALCDGIVTERTCRHEGIAPDAVTHIAGTDMRAMLLGGTQPDRHLMRPEIIDAVRDVPLFIDKEDS